jgi:DNA-binding NtrC family response regulator
VSGDRQTRTDDPPPTAPAHATQPYLVRALTCERPTTPPARWPLAGTTELVISGAATAADPATLACNDPWASTRHAALRRSFGRWLIEDLGSKNGTSVSGARVARHALVDGDLIETGHTTWWFRELAAEPLSGTRTLVLGAPFVTLHAPLEDAIARAIAAIAAGLPVLVAGETGVGKERAVAAMHAGSRRPGALVAINCAALPAALVEGELFGHRRGAFSGATDDRLGYLRAADRGTVFLDEIGDMPPAAQAVLLRVLAERMVTPVGDERPIAVDLAVVSATHRDVHAMASAGTFRADLLARLRGVTIHIPALRERREDIAGFVARTLARVAPAATLQLAAARRLLTAAWPLNVRELEHTVAGAALRAGPRAIAPEDLEGLTGEVPPPPAPAWSPADAELRARLVAALVAHQGNISAVARALGRDRKQIHRWLARLAIDARDPGA